MKTKIQIHVFLLFATMILSSCGILRDGAQYRNLNKVAVKPLPEKDFCEEDSMMTGEPLLSGINKIDKYNEVTNLENQVLANSDSGIALQNEKTTEISMHPKATQIIEFTERLLSRNLFRKHNGACSAKMHKKIDPMWTILMIGGIIVASFAVLGAMVFGFEGAAIMILVFGPLLILALAIGAIVKHENLDKVASENPAEQPAFIEEPVVQKEDINENPENANREHKPFPWLLVAVLALLAILVPMIGGVLILLVIGVACLAAAVALGIFFYNRVLSPKA